MIHLQILVHALPAALRAPPAAAQARDREG